MFKIQSPLPSLATLVTIYNIKGHYQGQGRGNLSRMYKNLTYKKHCYFKETSDRFNTS